jgi:hypothetical protein
MTNQKQNEVKMEFTPKVIKIRANIIIQYKKLWLIIILLTCTLIVVASSISFENREMLLDVLLGLLQVVFADVNTQPTTR